METEKIIKEVLLKLDGWIIDTETEDGEGDDLNSSLSSEYSDLDYNKKVTTEEVLDFYTVATNYALSYVKLSELPDNSVVDTALILWTAGLLWRKYNIRSNDNIDETYTIGYGDSLIIQAKEMLKGYKGYQFHAY